MEASTCQATTCFENPGVPTTLEGAVDPHWLERALSPFSNGDRVVSVRVIDVIKTMASKVRVAINFARNPERFHTFCLKAFLDAGDDGTGGLVTSREAAFYREIASDLTMRTPHCPAVIIDMEAGTAILIMSDLISAGAHFCSALEPFSLEQVSETLDQIARLHACADLLLHNHWIPCRVEAIAMKPRFSADRLQELMHDGRGGQLPHRPLDAALLLSAMGALAERNRSRPQTLLHGDCHAGNVYFTAEGPGFTDWQLVQRGNWALDVAYHVASVLPEEVAAREERRLLDHYLDRLHCHGGKRPQASKPGTTIAVRRYTATTTGQSPRR
jgi:hypothetical protein